MIYRCPSDLLPHSEAFWLVWNSLQITKVSMTIIKKVHFLMFIMVEIILSSSRFQFFFSGGQWPLTLLEERGLKASSSSTVTYKTTIQLLYLLSCLWKTIFKPLTYASLKKYIEDTYNVVKLESPLNVCLLMWVILLKVSILKTGKNITLLRYQT